VSRIDDLISEHCPEGVEFKPLGQVGQFIRGNGLQKKDFVDEGAGCIHYGQIYTHYGTSATETKSFVSPELAAKLRSAQPGDLVVATTSENDADVAKAVAWLGDDPVAVSGDSYVFKHSLDPLYASYFFQTDAFQQQKRRFITGTKVKRVSGTDLARIEIPVPPLTIQREIVSILTKMEALEAELEAELEARRRQYAHYLEILVTPDRGRVAYRPLRELGTFIRGKRFTKADYAEDGVPCIHYGEIYTDYGTSASSVRSHLRPDIAAGLRFAEPGDVVVVDVGEEVAEVGKAVAWMGSTPVAIHDHSYAFRHAMNPKYVAYVMQSDWFRRARQKYVARTKVNTLLIEGFSRIEFPVPDPSEQGRVVEILERFEELVSGHSAGLPAEARARRSQYEYYRDLLFDFSRLAA
jgi:type I restriction enzyme S subunit